jgi:hypothetical protein
MAWAELQSSDHGALVLRADEVLIGRTVRSSDGAIRLEYPQVSARHCVVRKVVTDEARMCRVESVRVRMCLVESAPALRRA